MISYYILGILLIVLFIIGYIDYRIDYIVDVQIKKYINEKKVSNEKAGN